jgi:outer membrane protease
VFSNLIKIWTTSGITIEESGFSKVFCDLITTNVVIKEVSVWVNKNAMDVHYSRTLRNRFDFLRSKMRVIDVPVVNLSNAGERSLCNAYLELVKKYNDLKIVSGNGDDVRRFIRQLLPSVGISNCLITPFEFYERDLNIFSSTKDLYLFLVVANADFRVTNVTKLGNIFSGLT